MRQTEGYLPIELLKVSVDQITNHCCEGFFKDNLINSFTFSFTKTEVLLVMTNLISDVSDYCLCIVGHGRLRGIKGAVLRGHLM